MLVICLNAIPDQDLASQESVAREQVWRMAICIDLDSDAIDDERAVSNTHHVMADETEQKRHLGGMVKYIQFTFTHIQATNPLRIRPRRCFG